MGLHGSRTVELSFDNMKVPVVNRLGEEGEGFKIAMANLDVGRIGIAAQALGIAEACLEAATDYAKERVQFGKPIAAQQGVGFKLADMATSVEAARLLVYRAASFVQKDCLVGKKHRWPNCSLQKQQWTAQLKQSKFSAATDTQRTIPSSVISEMPK